MVRKDAWNDFNVFEFTKARFMAQDVIYPGEGFMCTWERGEIHCFGVKCPMLLLLLSHFSRVWLLPTPWTAAYQAPPSWDFLGKSTGVGCHRLLYLMHYGDLNGKELQKGGNICIYMAYSFCYAVKSNNIIKLLYSNKN